MHGICMTSTGITIALTALISEWLIASSASTLRSVLFVDMARGGYGTLPLH